jgi:hypothetical protein
MELSPAANPILRISGGVGVVRKSDRQPTVVAHAVADIEVEPAGQVMRFQQHPGRYIHRAWRPQAYPSDGAGGQPSLFEQLPNHAPHAASAILRTALGFGRCLQPGQRAPEVVYNPRLDVRPTEIDADVKRRLRFGIGQILAGL